MLQMRHIQVASAAVAAGCAAFLLCVESARGGPPFAVDDPGTVEPGRSTLLLRYEFVRARGQNTDSFPAATLTVGLPGKLELAINGGVDWPEGSGAADAGVRDLAVGLKWRIIEEDGGVPAVALDYTLSLPTGSAGLSAETVVHTPYVTFSWKIDEQWGVFGNVGVNVPDGGVQRPQFFAGAAIAYQATESWMIGMDVSGTTRVSADERSDLSIGIATQLALSESWTLMARVGRSVSGTQAVNVFVGIQLNF